MRLDLRVPMGMMFTLMGLLLLVFGMKTNGNATLYAPSLGINVNLWWGTVLLVFGLIVLFVGEWKKNRLAKENAPAEEKRMRPKNGQGDRK
ncbi:MAG TPA: hypothetical protein VMU48_08015 [Terracidiphilus sp.]|nr:hypothetical protein [Terracidiphilus sp.]